MQPANTNGSRKVAPTCFSCGKKTKLMRNNETGGYFWLCPSECKGSNGTTLTWSHATGRCNNDPRVVGAASKNHGRTYSWRRDMAHRLINAGLAVDMADAEDFMDHHGPKGAEIMLQRFGEENAQGHTGR